MDSKELLLTFSKESEQELVAELAHKTDKQGNDFHREHYFQLEKEFTKAAKLLSEEELEIFYFHYCRTGLLPLKGLEKTYPIWEAAYRKQVIFIDKKLYDYKFSRWTKLKGLVIFGYNDKTEIDKNNGFDDYSKFRKMYQKIDSYTNIPGMLKKVDYFDEFSQDESLVNRISKTLTTLEFIQDLYWDKTPKNEYQYHYSYTDLDFWGLVFVLILSEFEIAKKTITQFKKADYLPMFEEQMEILTRFETAKNKFNKIK